MNSNPPSNELIWTSWALHGLGFFIVTLAGGMVYFFALLPLKSQADDYHLQVDQVVGFIEKAELIQKTNEQLVVKVKNKKQHWDNLQKQIPRTSEESSFLSLITELSKRQKLKISSFSPGASRENRHYQQKQVQLKFSGTYFNLCHFLAGLNEIKRVKTIESLNCHRSKSKSFGWKLFCHHQLLPCLRLQGCENRFKIMKFQLTSQNDTYSRLKVGLIPILILFLGYILFIAKAKLCSNQYDCKEGESHFTFSPKSEPLFCCPN